MRETLFRELLASVREAGAIRRGKRAPTRAWDVATDGTRTLVGPPAGTPAKEPALVEPGRAADTRREEV